MLDSTSTFVATALASFVLGACCALALLAALRRRRRARPDVAYLRTHAVRLACAQHWARGSLLSSASEPWRPIVGSLALAALAVEDEATLVQLVGQLVGQGGTDPEVANVWRQARAELLAQRDRLEFEFLAGVRVDGAPGWNWARLQEEAAKQLAAAHGLAEQLVEKRRQPHAFS